MEIQPNTIQISESRQSSSLRVTVTIVFLNDVTATRDFSRFTKATLNSVRLRTFRVNANEE